METYKRHDLVWLSDTGKDFALNNIQNCIPPVPDNEARVLIFSVPAIPAVVRRQDTADDGMLCVGFSSPRIIEGVRLRIASKVPPDCIVMRKTPFDIAEYKSGHLSDNELLRKLMDAGRRYHTQIGYFGSTALQLVTGLPYQHRNSDIDIYLRHRGNRQELILFYEQLLESEKQFSVALDAEIEYAGQYGVKLKELFGPGKTVLGKGLYDVTLLEKTEEGSLRAYP